MNQSRTAIVLINVGTPNSPSIRDVKRYLSEFLNDPRIITIPRLLRMLLVNLIIIPIRSPKSAKLYQKLWTNLGSPLLVHGIGVRDKLQNKLGNKYEVILAMRYGNPSLNKLLNNLETEHYSKIVFLPLFPHYASSTTGSAIELIMNKLKGWNTIPEVKFIGQFYNHPGFINALITKINAYHPENYDHVIFSYHGLPDAHIEKIHPEIKANECNCAKEFPAHGAYCYKATCYETTRLLVDKLNLASYSTSFQSRFSKKWISPFTDDTIKQKADEGMKRILIIAPSFVADCLETTIEIGIDYKNLFLNNGGNQLDFVEGLNDSSEWIEAVKEMVV